MKSIEEIDRRLKEEESKQYSIYNNINYNYLKLAKDNYNNEYWLKHLLRKYTYEIEEDSAIVEILRWVLNLDEKED